MSLNVSRNLYRMCKRQTKKSPLCFLMIKGPNFNMEIKTEYTTKKINIYLVSKGGGKGGRC